MSERIDLFTAGTRAGLAAVLIAALAVPAEAQRQRRERPPPAEPQPVVAPEPPPEPEPEPETSPETPWSKGVSAEHQATARRLLDRGNELFLAGEHREALASYREATESWDHPAIRFNMVRALIQIDRPVEAFENLEAALRHGSAPLGDELFQEAQNYHRLLLGQIAELEVTCAQEEIRVTVNGQEYLTCPGARTTKVLPGAHQVVASRPGHLTLTRDLIALPGAKESLEVALVALADATTIERRWDWWKPWAVVGTGAAVGGAGALLQRKAKADFERYGEALERRCSETACLPEEITAERDLASRARLENRIAVSALVTGGALVLTGLSLVILNRERALLPDESMPEGRVQLVPEAGRSGGGVSIVTRF